MKCINLAIIFIILLFLLPMGFCGENNTTYTDTSIINYTLDNVVQAEEDGHFNINFSDGSKGYCIEYMEEEAKENDTFYVADTSYATNKYTGEDVSNYLKIYFIDYYDYAMKDKVVTQHMIWHFTDDFDGWRVNHTLVDLIKNSPNKYSDSGVKQINNTTEMVYRFNVFLAEYTHHQNYWGYNIFFRNITNDTIVDENVSVDINNTTNIIIPLHNNLTENITLQNISNMNVFYDSNVSNVNTLHENNNTLMGDTEQIITNHNSQVNNLLCTGHPIWGLICTILLIICIIGIYKQKQ